MEHAFVRGAFSSSGFSSGGRGMKRTGNADDAWEDRVLNAHMSIGDSMTLLEYDEGLRKTAGDPVARLFGIYERPEPSFSGCFRPLDRAMPGTTGGCRCEPIVRQEQTLPPDQASRAAMIAGKWRRHREHITRKW
jgi:hypothetical protein